MEPALNEPVIRTSFCSAVGPARSFNGAGPERAGDLPNLAITGDWTPASMEPALNEPVIVAVAVLPLFSVKLQWSRP